MVEGLHTLFPILEAAQDIAQAQHGAIGIIRIPLRQAQGVLIGNLRFLIPALHTVDITDPPGCPLGIRRMRLFAHQRLVLIDNFQGPHFTIAASQRTVGQKRLHRGFQTTIPMLAQHVVEVQSSLRKLPMLEHAEASLELRPFRKFSYTFKARTGIGQDASNQF
jgi:hypothetical protein